ncbi:hypothetical protein B0H10DRAFT_1944949 [Mycena sp. CBHHK59/15]|nr:hypothetical protein B0H10DRAFT_1944949 [Mycena sp. CBHHK59/15]
MLHTEEETLAPALTQLKAFGPLIPMTPVMAIATPNLAATTPIPATTTPMPVTTTPETTTPVPPTTTLRNTGPTMTKPAAPSPATAAPAVTAVAQVIADHTHVNGNDTPAPGSGRLGPTEGPSGLEAPPDTSKAWTKAARPALKDKKAVPGPSKTAMNLCLIDWCPRHPGGLTPQYKVYWTSIKNTVEAEQWIKASSDVAAAKSKPQGRPVCFPTSRWVRM